MNKVGLLLGLGVGLMILNAGSLPVFAGSQRYPTNAEVQRLIRQFRQQSSSPPVPTPGECCGGWEADRRTPAQKQPLETFVRTWSRVDPAVAPFLGQWIKLIKIKFL